MPLPSGNSTYMNTIDGNKPMLDGNNVLQNFIYAPRIAAKTADYTVTAKETGTIFTTIGATANVNFTLPAISDGPFIFWFVNGVDLNMTVTAAAADTLITFNDVAADSVAYSTSSEKIGGFVIVICDGTSIFALTPIIAHSQTVTVATS